LLLIGTVWNVGYNGYGAFGIGSTSDYSVPQVMFNEDGTNILTGIREISATLYSTYLVTEERKSLQCRI